MPTNVTFDYLKAEDEYREAVTDQQKLQALEKMLSTIRGMQDPAPSALSTPSTKAIDEKQKTFDQFSAEIYIMRWKKL